MVRGGCPARTLTSAIENASNKNSMRNVILPPISSTPWGRDSQSPMRRATIEFVNPAYARLVGCESTALIGKHLRDVTVPEDHDFQAEKRAERQAGKTSTYEVRFRRADGGVVPVPLPPRRGEATARLRAPSRSLPI